MWTLTLLPSTTPEATPTPTNHRLSGRGVLYETTCKSVLLNSRECQLLFFFPFSLVKSLCIRKWCLEHVGKGKGPGRGEM